MQNAKNQIPTIDCNLVTVSTVSGEEMGFDTANQVEVEVQTEDEDAVRLVVKGRLRAQKPAESTITGHELTLHDNVFIPELVKVLQGGTILYFQDAAHTTTGETATDYGVAEYHPPVAGSADKGEAFVLNTYSAIYDTAGQITGYEKTSYPNCQGTPVAFNTEDGTFRTPEYTINSAPKTGEAPYTMTFVDKLPELEGSINTTGPDLSVNTYTITQTLTNAVSSNNATAAKGNSSFTTTITAEDGYTISDADISVSMGGTSVKDSVLSSGVITIEKVIGDITITATGQSS